jgi:hypothetical protein
VFVAACSSRLRCSIMALPWKTCQIESESVKELQKGMKNFVSYPVNCTERPDSKLQEKVVRQNCLCLSWIGKSVGESSLTECVFGE